MENKRKLSNSDLMGSPQSSMRQALSDKVCFFKMVNDCYKLILLTEAQW